MMWLQGHIDRFEIFGGDYPTPDGTAIRDYVHVCDLADAHVSALQQLRAGQQGGIFNLGTGRGYSVRQVLTEIERVTSTPILPCLGKRRMGDPPVLVADPLATEQLGFSPSRSDLETICANRMGLAPKSAPAHQVREKRRSIFVTR